MHRNCLGIMRSCRHLMLHTENVQHLVIPPLTISIRETLSFVFLVTNKPEHNLVSEPEFSVIK